MELTELEPQAQQDAVEALQTELSDWKTECYKLKSHIEGIHRSFVSAVTDLETLDDTEKADLLREAGVPEEYIAEAFTTTFEVEVRFAATIYVTKTLEVEAPIGAEEDQIIDALEDQIGIDVQSQMQDCSIWEFDFDNEDWEIESFEEQ